MERTKEYEYAMPYVPPTNIPEVEKESLVKPSIPQRKAKECIDICICGLFSIVAIYTLVIGVVVFVMLYPSSIHPHQIHLAVTRSSNTIVVQWTTMAELRSGVVEWGIDPLVMDHKVTAQSSIFLDGEHSVHIHVAKLESLAPGVKYYYRVACSAILGEIVSRVYEFETMKHQSNTIAVFGNTDIQHSELVMEHLRNETILGKIHMAIHLGDMAYNLDMDNGKRADQFMDMIEPIASRIPFMTAMGDQESANNFTQWSHHFSGIKLTGESSGSNTNWFYSFDIPYAHIIVISTEVYFNPDLKAVMQAQYHWLKQDLQRVSSMTRGISPWIVVVGHRPMYCSNVKSHICSSDAQLLRNGNAFPLEPLFSEYGVHLYLSAHLHEYERTYPVRNGIAENTTRNSNVYSNPKFPVYVVAPSTHQLKQVRNKDSSNSWSAVRFSTSGYGHLTVHNGTHLEWNLSAPIEDKVVIVKKLRHHHMLQRTH